MRKEIARLEEDIEKLKKAIKELFGVLDEHIVVDKLGELYIAGVQVENHCTAKVISKETCETIKGVLNNDL